LRTDPRCDGRRYTGAR